MINKHSSKFTSIQNAWNSFEKIKVQYKGISFLILPVIIFLLCFFWYLQGKRRRLEREIAHLQADKRLLYVGNTSLPEVALTFDDGPQPSSTPNILAILQQYGVKATFFCVGQSVAAYPHIVRQAHGAGHLIANHSWSHPNMAFLSRSSIVSQLTRTSEIIQQVIHIQPIFFRPPYGALSCQVLKCASHSGLTTILWDVRATDWAKPGVDVLTSRILSRSVHGSIILLHDGGGDRSETVAALPAIIYGLQQRGFTFVTLEQMVNRLDVVSSLVRGQKYSVWGDLFMQLFPIC